MIENWNWLWLWRRRNRDLAFCMDDKAGAQHSVAPCWRRNLVDWCQPWTGPTAQLPSQRARSRLQGAVAPPRDCPWSTGSLRWCCPHHVHRTPVRILLHANNDNNSHKLGLSKLLQVRSKLVGNVVVVRLTPDKQQESTEGWNDSNSNTTTNNNKDSVYGAIQRWDRVSGSRFTGSAILAGLGRVTGQCVRPSVWPGFEF